MKKKKNHCFKYWKIGNPTLISGKIGTYLIKKNKTKKIVWKKNHVGVKIRAVKTT